MSHTNALLTITALVLGGCVHDPSTRMNYNQVVAKACHAASEHGYILDEYADPRIRLTQDKGAGTWTVLFERKPPTPPGGHFLVLVDDNSGTTSIFEGR